MRPIETKTIYKGVIIALLIIIGFFAWREMNDRGKYYAVYLTSGDVYFGKLRFFPSLVMKDAYFLQAEESGGYVLSHFSDALWEPQGTIEFNRDTVLWIAELSEASKAATFIKQGGVSAQQPNGAIQSSPSYEELPALSPEGMDASATGATSTDGSLPEEVE